jgi:hypothetical protein
MERAIHSLPHKRLTASLRANYHARVEEWMANTREADVPQLPQRPLSMGDLETMPYKFYRTRSPTRGGGAHSASGAHSDRSGGGGTKNGAFIMRTSVLRNNGDGSNMYTAPVPDGDHMQMSPSRWQSEQQRLAAYEKSDERSLLTGAGVYVDPLAYSYRLRAKQNEVGGPFVYSARAERLRVSEEITDRDIGGAAFPYEQPKLYPEFREENKDKWRVSACVCGDVREHASMRYSMR